MYKTHTCGELRVSHVGKTIILVYGLVHPVHSGVEIGQIPAIGERVFVRAD